MDNHVGQVISLPLKFLKTLIVLFKLLEKVHLPVMREFLTEAGADACF